MPVELFTDGAYSNGHGGWAFVAVCDNVIIHEESGYEGGTTNNRMELMAIVKAMQWMLYHEHYGIVITTDSQYARGALDGRNQVLKNSDLVYTGRTLYHAVTPTLEWVKGHARNFYNEHVDKLAVAARKLCEQEYLAAPAAPTHPRPKKVLKRLKKDG